MELTGKNYQMTEVGLIPKDWDVKLLMEICSPAKARINPLTATESYKCVELEHLSQETGRLLGYTDSKDLKSQKTVFQKNDILFGKLRPYLKKYLFAKFDGVCTSEIWVLKSPSNIDNKWLYYLVQSNRIIDAANQSTGTKMPRAEWKTVGSTPIPLPSTKSEQIAIANALSDIDALLENLEILIAKKQNIKQGAMQELLTGKKRLSGFSGNWEVKKLGEICCNITTGKLDANAMVENGEYRFYTCAKDYYYIDKFAFDTEALLVSGNGANVGYIHYYKGKFNAYQRTYVLYDFSKNIQFVKIFMDFYLKIRITSEVNAGNTPYIKMDTLTDMGIRIPKSIEEQETIAVFLTDMDNEIQVLEKKLHKYKMIKQGMMQELLTGKIRLS